MVPPFLVKKWPFCQKVKKTLSLPDFLDAIIVAPIFLDMCIEVFGAWVNHKKISNSDIFEEDRAVFAKDGFLAQKLCHGEDFHHQPSFINEFIDIQVEI